MSDSGRDTVVIRSVRELVGSVPVLLGFEPGPGSLVAVCGPDGGGVTGPVMRVDLPALAGPPPGRWSVPAAPAGDGDRGESSCGDVDDDFRGDDVDAAWEEYVEGEERDDAHRDRGKGGYDRDDADRLPVDASVAQYLADLCTREGIGEVWLVVVQPGVSDDRDEWHRVRDQVESLEWWLSTAGVRITAAHAVDRFAEGEPIVGLLGSADGVQVDPDCTELAATHSFRGDARFRDRAEIEALYIRRDPDASDSPGDGRAPQVQGRRSAASGERAHDAAVSAFARGEGVSDEWLAHVGARLLDVRVRDRVLADLGRRPLAAEDARRDLWWALARRRPPRERSVALCLLGSAAYHSGSGTHARAALEEALRADRYNTLAALTLQALEAGIRPEHIRAAAV